MTRLTAIELGTNYPENIKIDTAEENGKFAVFCYLLKGGEIHKLMLSSSPNFKSAESANKYLHDLAKHCKDEYGEKPE